jgi:hypothetical protein
MNFVGWVYILSACILLTLQATQNKNLPIQPPRPQDRSTPTPYQQEEVQQSAIVSVDLQVPNDKDKVVNPSKVIYNNY